MKYIRIAADLGGSDSSVDARILDFEVVASEPAVEAVGPPSAAAATGGTGRGWLLVVGGLSFLFLILIGGSFWLLSRRGDTK
jgi:hypothetical protein